MIEEAAVEERLRRTYADIAARTDAHRPRTSLAVGDEPSGALASMSPTARWTTRGYRGGGVCVRRRRVRVHRPERPPTRTLVEVSPTTPAPSLSPATGLTRLTLPGSCDRVSLHARSVAVTPDGGTAYVGGSHDGVVDADRSPKRPSTPTDHASVNFPSRRSPSHRTDERRMSSRVVIADIVVPIDLATGTVGPAIHVAGPRGLGSSIAITPDGRTAYVSSLSEDEDSFRYHRGPKRPPKSSRASSFPSTSSRTRPVGR